MAQADPVLLDLGLIRELAEATADSGPEFLRAVLERFASDAGECIERMRQQARNGDTVSLAHEAHRLGGSSGTLGAILLAAQCLEIERAAHAGLCVGMEARLEQARDVLEATRARLAVFFGGTMAAAA